MADTKLSALTEITTVQTNDRLYIEDATGPTSNAIKYEDAFKEVITTSSDSNYSLGKVIIPGLAGSPNIAGVSGAGTSEEYDTSTTGLTWTSAPTTCDSDTTVKSHLYVRVASSLGTEYIGYKAWAPAGAFDARTCCNGISTEGITNYVHSAGLLIMNSDNSTRLYCGIALNPSTRAYTTYAYTYASSTWTQRGGSWTVPSFPQYWRITRDGSNNCSFWFSTTGFEGSYQIMETCSFTLTVARIGFRLAPGNASASVLSTVYDWLRTNV